MKIRIDRTESIKSCKIEIRVLTRTLSLVKIIQLVQKLTQQKVFRNAGFKVNGERINEIS